MSSGTPPTYESEGTYYSDGSVTSGPDKLSCYIPNEDSEGLTSKKFVRLLRDLATEHYRALRALHVENQNLRRELKHCPPRPPPPHATGLHSSSTAASPPRDAPPGWQPVKTHSSLTNSLELPSSLTNKSLAKAARKRASTRGGSVDFDFRISRNGVESKDVAWEGSRSSVGKAVSVQKALHGERTRDASELRQEEADGPCPGNRLSQSSAFSGVPEMPTVIHSAISSARASRVSGLLSCSSMVSVEAVATRQTEMSRALEMSRRLSHRASVARARQSLCNRPSEGNALSIITNGTLPVPSGMASVRTSAARASGVSMRSFLPLATGEFCAPTASVSSMDSVMSESSLAAHATSSDGGSLEDEGFEVREIWAESSRMRCKTVSAPASLKMACTLDLDHMPITCDKNGGSTRTSQASSAPSCSRSQSQMTNTTIGLHHDFAPNHVNVLVLLWQLLGTCTILWDVVWLPLQIFQPEETDGVNTMMWIALLFWTLDLLVSFFSSYSENGVTVSELKKIANHYLRTWFAFDFVVVTIDWILMTIDSKTGFGSILGVLRMVRTVRLFRVFKCRRVFDEIHNHINSEYTSIVASIVTLVFMLLIANHFIACAWYGIGWWSDHADLPSWLERGGFLEESFAYTYTTSMHWSLTQFTPASMDVQPANVPERIFTIVVIVIALVCFSSFLSSITSSITQLRSMTEDDRRQFWLLRKFFMDSQVSLQLASRITRYLEYATAHRKAQVQESQIKILSMLSDQLHNELQCATRVPHVQCHPLFAYINFVSNVTMHRLAARAFSRISLAVGDPLFFQGELATLMSFVIDGEFQYILGDMPHWIESGDWMCEPVLWTHWIHPGEMLAMTESEVLSVNAHEFGAAVQANPAVWMNVRGYAEAFCQAINEIDGNMLSDMKCLDPTFEENLCSQLGFSQPEEKQKINSAASYIGRLLSGATPTVASFWSMTSASSKNGSGRKSGSWGPSRKSGSWGASRKSGSWRQAFSRNGKSVCAVAP